LASADIIEFQPTEAYSSLDLTRVKYNSRHSKDERAKVRLRTTHSNAIYCENVELT
jgi:hypothetical protein